MSVYAWAFVMIGASFSLYIGVALRSRARSTGEFYIAGGQVPAVINGMATAADWMSAASFISMAGLISFMGRDGSVYLMGWTGGYVLLALLLAPYTESKNDFCGRVVGFNETLMIDDNDGINGRVEQGFQFGRCARLLACRCWIRASCHRYISG